jgi:hypothetical protein
MKDDPAAGSRFSMGAEPSGGDHLFEMFGVSGGIVPETPNT